MEAVFAVEDLVTMKRVQLQKLCKTVGIKANSKTTQLVEGLKEYATMHYSTQSEDGSTVVAKGTINAVEHNVEQLVTDNEYKQEVLGKLESKVKEKLPKSCIPRFVAKGVRVPVNTTPAGSNLKDWSKIHQAQFDKMDSIDVYLAKKRKRRENMDNCSTKKTKESKSTLHTKKSLGESAKKMFNPSVTITKSGIFVFDKNRKSAVGTKTVTIQEKDGKSRLKSPKIFRASTLGFSFSATSGDQNKPKTPAVKRKSLAATPYRLPPGVMNTPAAATPTPRKKFDLQTSLAKPLSYKPYTGKLPELSHSEKDEDEKPTKRVKVVEHKVDMKAVKVSTRGQRRNKATKNRVDKRSEAMSNRRRGLVR